MRNVAVLVVAVLALAGCGAPEQAATRGEAGVDPAALMIHPVLRESEPPCGETAPGEEILPETKEGKVISCLAIGPAALDARQVKAPSLSKAAGEWLVNVELTEAGAETLNRLAPEYLGKRLAITVHGALASAPTVQSAEFEGRLQVSGLSEGQAKDLVKELGGDPAPPTTGDKELERAGDLCARFRKDGKLTIWLATTAGEVTKLARAIQQQPVAPWDSLLPDHFMARCGYDEMPAVEHCPDGQPAQSARAFLVDEEGRSTEDPLQPACPPPGTGGFMEWPASRVGQPPRK